MAPMTKELKLALEDLARTPGCPRKVYYVRDLQSTIADMKEDSRAREE